MKNPSHSKAVLLGGPFDANVYSITADTPQILVPIEPYKYGSEGSVAVYVFKNIEGELAFYEFRGIE
jgi:hypothetical protein